MPPVCVDWYMVIYDGYTGNVLSESYMYTSCYSPCNFTNGGSSGTSNSCSNLAQQLNSGPYIANAGMEAMGESANERTFAYHWQFHKQVNGWWAYYSHEEGVHKKENNVWKWKSLTHNSISRTGMTFGASINCTVHTAIPVVGIYFAGMQLNYTIESSLICEGFPMTRSKNHDGNSPMWDVNQNYSTNQ